MPPARRARLLERNASAAAGGRGGGRRGGGLPSTLPVKAGMNRFVWDLRYPAGRRAPAATWKAAASALDRSSRPAASRRASRGGVTKTESSP